MFKSQDKLIQVERTMREGKLAAYRFLGTDPRPLEEILAVDQLTVEQAQLKHRDIAQWLMVCLRLGLHNPQVPIQVGDRYRIELEETRGTIPCPFADNFHAPKRTVTVTNLHLNKMLVFAELNIHLIEAHGFYEGKGSPYRIEPQQVIEMFGGGQLWVIS